MASLDDLPFEVTIFIFEYLDINSLLKCRELNSKFMNIVEKVRIKSMSVCENPLIYQNFECRMDGIISFFYTNKQLKGCNYFQSKNSNLFKSDIMKTILCKIKKLHIERAPSSNLNSFNLDRNINQFESLEQLQIGYLKVRKGYVLRLPNLKILEIHNMDSTCYKDFRIDCRLLFAFKTVRNMVSTFIFERPDTITHLVLEESYYSGDLDSFVNLESITLMRENRYFNLTDYTQFKHLKELCFYNCHETTLKELLDMKRSLCGKFKIYLKGLCIENDEDVYSYSKNLNHYDPIIDTKFLCSNYSKTRSCMNFCRNIDYTVLTTMLGSVPDNFFVKFFNLLKVKVSPSEKGINQEKFIDFIKQIKNLRVLDLEESFDQLFYNDLYDYCPLLTRLEIKETKKIDLDFLFSLKNLQKFEVNQAVSLEKVKSVYETLNSLNSFKFIYGEKKVTISTSYVRDVGSLFYFCWERLSCSFKSLEHLVGLFKKIDELKKEKFGNKKMVEC